MATRVVVGNWDADKKEIVDSITVEDTVDRIMLIKVGDKDRPATLEDIEDVQRSIAEVIKKSKDEGGTGNPDDWNILVAHHAIKVEKIKLT